MKFDKPLIPYSSHHDGLPTPPGPPPSANPIKDSIKRKKVFLLLAFIFIVHLVYYTLSEGETYIRRPNFNTKETKDRLVQAYKGWKETRPKLLTSYTSNRPPKIKLPPPIIIPAVLTTPFIRIKEVIIEATTVLGLAAEESYKLGPTADPKAYQLELESFIRTSFPLADSDETNPNSLINAMRAFFPLPAPQVSSKHGKKAKPVNYGPIAQKIFQTAATSSARDLQAEKVGSWSRLNPGWNITFHDDQRADDWVKERFEMEKGNDAEARSVVGAWTLLDTPKVLRSDFWRYLVICSEGGYYSDTDVEALKPSNTWGEDPQWQGQIPTDYTPPSFIAGVETDVGSRADWQLWWIRPLQISQWTFASARGHPILIDAIRRIVQSAYPGPLSVRLPVIERTGPGCFTDAVMRFLKVKYNKTWNELRSLKEEGWRYRSEENKRWGDIKILQITGFSPGAGAHMGAGEAYERHAMVKHGFAGSWRGKGDGAE